MALRFLALLMSLSLSLQAPAYAQADYAREKRWADEITPSVLVGEPLYLALASGRRFLTLHAPQPVSAPAIIVVHGIGVHPDWGLINTLRSALAEAGYATLSLQMPVLAADARAEAYAPLYPEAAERLAVAVDFMRRAGHRRLAIVSHSLGSRMTDVFLARQPDGINAWVAIGMTGTYANPSALRFPVLDLYGEKDLPGVLETVASRAAALAHAGQVRVAGADHFFAGCERELVSVVKTFLDRELRR